MIFMGELLVSGRVRGSQKNPSLKLRKKKSHQKRKMDGVGSWKTSSVGPFLGAKFGVTISGAN